MKSPIKALLTAIILFTAYASAQQNNPTADPCCACLDMTIHAVKKKDKTPLSPDDSVPFDKDGIASVKFQIANNGSTGCPDTIKVKVVARPVGSSKGDHTKTLNVDVTTSGPTEGEFVFTEANKKLSKKWEIVYSCGEKLCESPYEIDLGAECKACQVCPNGGGGGGGGGDGTNGGFRCNSDGSADLLTPISAGDLQGTIRYNLGDIESATSMTHPGIAGLTAMVPKSFAVTYTAGRLTSIDTGNTLIQITPAPIPGDLNAFVVTYSNKGSSEPPFRTTTISLVTNEGYNRLRYDTTFAGATLRYDQYKTNIDTRIVEVGRLSAGASASLRQVKYAKSAPAPGTLVYRITTKERPIVSTDWDSPSLIVSDTETTWEKQIFGWVKTKEVIDPAGDALTSTWSYYQPGETTGVTTTGPEIQYSEGGSSGNIPLANNNSSTRGLGLLKQISRYDGYQAFFTYTLNSTTITQPYAENPSGKVTTITWNPGSQTETTTTKVNGIITSEESTTHSPTTVVYPRKLAASGATLSKSSILKPSGSDFGGKIQSMRHEDGTLTTYSYTRNDDAFSGFTTVTETGFSGTNGTTVLKGTRTTTTVNSRGTTILRKTEGIGYGTGNAIFDSMAVTEVDYVGRPVTTAYHPESAVLTGETVLATNPAWTTTTEYSCCGIASQTDKYGIITTYSYDGLQRQIKSNRLGVTTEIEHLGTLDENQQTLIVVETKRYADSPLAPYIPPIGSTGSPRVSRSVRNISGTLQQSWIPNPTSTAIGALVISSSSVTTYINTAAANNIPITLGIGIGSRTVTTTTDGFSQTTDYFRDGRTAKTYGDLSPAMEYEYSVNTIGEVTSQSYLNTENLKLETTSTQTDWDGRTLRMDYMDGAFATMEYNSLGQMEKSTDPDGVVTLMRYNTEGEQTITAIDLNRNGNVDYGSDAVQFSETVPSLDYSPDNAPSFEYIPEANAIGKPVWKSISKVWQPGETSPTGGTVVSTSIQAPNGLKSVSQSIGVANLTTQLTVLNGNGSWTTTSTAPDGIKSVSNYSDGKMVSMARLATNSSVIESQTQGYDNLNRPTTSTHSRTGTSLTNYLSSTADVVVSVSDPGGRTTAFVYDIRGRQISVDAPDTVDANNQPLSNVTTTTYNPDSTVAETNGDQTYRVTNIYDYANRMISMTTYGTETATTTWQYSPTRGFLLAKRDAANKGATYSYKASGRLLNRTWARGVVTTYSYDNGGRMIYANYSDTTPDVTIAYDAMGRQISQSNVLATNTFAYNTSNLRIDTETIAYNLDGQPGADFTRVIDRSQDNLGRASGWTLGEPMSTSAFDNEVAYNYSTTDGRLASVNRGSDSFSYLYAPSSSLIATVTSPVHTVSNVYETTRNVLASKVNKKLDTTTVSGYFYTVNNYGQRTGVTTDGTAFANTPSWVWGYNSKGEVVKADSSEAGLDRAYAYDGIGNRTSGGNQGSPISYTANALNQYSAIGSLTPVHDEDGNMTSGPLPANVNVNSTLIWDAENRLIEAQVNSGATVNFVYDSQSRRIAETVGSSTTVYIYDGWNPIAEYSFQSSQFTLHSSFTWGLDLSGSMQGAGGVGGLLMVKVGSAGPADRYFPTYDGNGNVSEYLDSTGDFVAHYEYDPFGKTTVATGSKANDFAHRFSTKPLDVTTGLYYYGYRYYDPETGRWPSRDPIQDEVFFKDYTRNLSQELELDALLALEDERLKNPYRFIDNDSLNHFDLFGLQIEVDDKGGKCCKNPRRDTKTGRFASKADLYKQVSNELNVKPAAPGQKPQFKPGISKAIGRALGKGAGSFGNVKDLVDYMTVLTMTAAAAKCILAREAAYRCICDPPESDPDCENAQAVHNAVCAVSTAIKDGLFK